MPLEREPWRRLADAQAGLVTRGQLAALGMPGHAVDYRLRTERWARLAPRVVATFTGQPTPEQQLWLGVLHASAEEALVAGVHAASLAGLRNWDRPEISVLVPYGRGRPQPLAGYVFRRTRHAMRDLSAVAPGVPRCRVEPAVLMFAARDKSVRSGEGILAASVQQRLATPESLLRWLDRLPSLPRSGHLRSVLEEIGGGAHSVAELDVKRMCRRFGLALPARQVKRRDASGRVRFTDCEWTLADGRVLVLEVDGSFHFEVEHWEDDLARQRALAATGRVTVHSSARELRDEADVVARDLIRLGIPRAA